MIIREATVFDHTGIMKCLIKMLDELNKVYPAPNNALASWITGVLVNGYGLVAEEEGEIVATFGGSFVTYPWNSEVVLLNENWFFVDKKHRKYGVARKMVSHIKNFADNRGISIKFDVMCDTDAEKKDLFFEMQGMIYLGGNFIYGVGAR